MKEVSVLFVCLGNICRSPTAEGIFLKTVKDEGLESLFEVDSAGTSAHHAGEMADARMRKAAIARGYELLSISRQFTQDDFEKFNYILAMDYSNKDNMLKVSSSKKDSSKIFMMSDFCSKFEIEEVPDPYFGGEEGFNHVVDILEDASKGLLKKIKRES